MISQWMIYLSKLIIIRIVKWPLDQVLGKEDLLKEKGHNRIFINNHNLHYNYNQDK